MAIKENNKPKKNHKPVKVDEGPVKKVKIMAWTLIISGISAILYWILFYATNLFALAEPDLFESYRSSFIFGGIWFIIVSIASGILLLVKKEDGLVYGLLAGGTLVFGGLLSTRFYFANKLYNHVNFAMGFETFVILFCLIIGGYISTNLWNNRDKMLIQKEAWPLPPMKKKKKK